MIRAGQAVAMCLCGGLLLGIGGLGAPAAQADVSYQGKTLSVIINSTAGGGTDITARMVGGLLPKYLPGQPQVIFRNMPGGGGVTAGNHFASRVPPDGLTLLAGSRSQISPAKLRQPQVKYDPAKYQFIGGDANLGTIMVVRRETVARLTDPAAQPVVYGDFDGMRSGILLSLWAKEAANWNLRWVVGYAGQAALSMAVQSGELDAMANQNVARIQPMLSGGQYVAVAQIGVRDDSGQIVRRSTFPDVPLFSDIILPNLDGAARTAFLNMYADFLVNKWVALPPKTPANHVQAYRASYQMAVKDPEFRKFAEGDMGPEYTPLSCEQLQTIVADLGNTSDADITFVKALAKKYGVTQVD